MIDLMIIMQVNESSLSLLKKQIKFHLLLNMGKKLEHPYSMATCSCPNAKYNPLTLSQSAPSETFESIEKMPRSMNELKYVWVLLIDWPPICI